MLVLLFKLLIGHSIADFALQSDTMAKGKNRHRRTEPPPGATYQPSWFFWLPAHALIHAGAVWVVLGRWEPALLEFIVHSVIDFGKCENLYGMKTDQALHVLSKVAWACMAVAYG